VEGGRWKVATEGLPAEDASVRRKIVGAAQTQTSAQDRTGAHRGTADTDDDAQCDRDDPRGIPRLGLVPLDGSGARPVCVIRANPRPAARVNPESFPHRQHGERRRHNSRRRRDSILSTASGSDRLPR